jgi:RNA polymerase sigma-70 factor (ECF subfamily)
VRLDPSTIDRAFHASGGDRWALPRDVFAEAVRASVARAFAGREPARREIDHYVSSLHVEDLALACACAIGRETAWEYFVREHRPGLYRAADAIDPAGGVREIADSLYAELYGIRGADERRSLFAYFLGRSSLATWLRAVLVQRHVDALRSRRRLEPLTEAEAAIPAAGQPADPDRTRLVGLVESALRLAIDHLSARDRLRLRSYYAVGLTLAETGRITGEHEATVSRNLSRTRRSLRESVERHLRSESGLNRDQIARAFELALEDPGAMDLGRLIAADSKESPSDRSR